MIIVAACVLSSTNNDSQLLFSSFFSCSPVSKIDVFELVLLSDDEVSLLAIIVCFASSFRTTDASEDADADDDELTGCESAILLLLLGNGNGGY